MAEMPFVHVAELPGNANLYLWEQLDADTDFGTRLEAPGAADKTVQVVGALGSSDTLTMQGSNDGTNWFTMKDALGEDAIWADGDEGAAKVILENPRYIRPLLSVTTSADVDIYVCTRLNR